MMEIEITVGILYAKSSLRMDRSDHSVPDAPIVGPAFTGEWRTGGTGMQYHRARHLSPGLGVWLSLDPFEGISSRPMSLNGYSWVEGQFPSTTDPSGRETRLQCYQTCVDNPCHYNENDPLYWVDEVFPRPDPYYIADGYCPEIGHQPWQGEFQRCVMRCDYFHTNRFDAYKQAPTFGDVAGGLLMALALGGGSCGDRLMLGLVGAARNPGLIAGRAVSTANPYIATAAVLGILTGTVILTLTAGTVRDGDRTDKPEKETLYRGDRSTMTPAIVFVQGFLPKGPNTDLVRHVQTNGANSIYVSTSRSQDIAFGFAGRNGYVYVIRTNRGIDVNAYIELLRRTQPDIYYFPEQQEVAIPGGVFSSEIVGAYPKHRDQYTGEYIQNPNYSGE